MKRVKPIITALMLLIAFQMNAQVKKLKGTQYPGCFKGDRMTVPLKADAVDSLSNKYKYDTLRKARIIRRPMPKEPIKPHQFGQSDKPYDTFNDGSENNEKAITPAIGRNFGANNLTKGATPPDNSLAISNGGFIFSADNRTADCYTDGPDTLQQFVKPWSVFETNPALLIFGDGFSDPRSLYDLQNDRFINVIQNDGTFQELSKLVISFSQTNDPSGLWNHYEIKCSSIFPGTDYWFDYPNIAVNNSDLYVTINVYLGSTFVNNAVFQIVKSNGFDGLPLNYIPYTDIRNTSNSTQYTLVPLSHSMQDNSYGSDMYFVSNDGANSDSLYWTKLIGYPDLGDQVIFTYSLATVPYSTYAYASQPGGSASNRINPGDCRVQSGYFQNGKLHFVYTRSNSAWGQIVYSRINIATNTEQRATYGAGSPNNYCFLSIAHFGSSNTEENAMICFLKVGTSTFPTIGVINHDALGFGTGVTVKAGIGLVDIVEYDGADSTYERLGDYTSIQRRYNASQPTCWLSGGYAFGNTANHFNQTNGLNTWIAEIGSAGVGLTNEGFEQFEIYPNPVVGSQVLNFDFIDNDEKQITILNVQGQVLYKTKTIGKTQELQIYDFSSGTYIIKITSNNKNYENRIFIKL